jgi:hypothetical protein
MAFFPQNSGNCTARNQLQLSVIVRVV